MNDQPNAVGASNRRAHPRYPLKAMGSAWCLSRAAGPLDVTATDISLGGMMLHTNSGEIAAVQTGDELLLGFPEPGAKTRMSFKARLAWKQRGLVTLAGSWSFGVRFHDTPEADVRKLLGPAERNEPLPEPKLD